MLLDILLLIFTCVAILSTVIEIIWSINYTAPDPTEGYSNQLKFKAHSYPQNPTYMNYEGRLNTVMTGNLF